MWRNLNAGITYMCVHWCATMSNCIFKPRRNHYRQLGISLVLWEHITSPKIEIRLAWSKMQQLGFTYAVFEAIEGFDVLV
jgi:hypothetical protein